MNDSNDAPRSPRQPAGEAGAWEKPAGAKSSGAGAKAVENTVYQLATGDLAEEGSDLRHRMTTAGNTGGSGTGSSASAAPPLPQLPPAPEVSGSALPGPGARDAARALTGPQGEPMEALERGTRIGRYVLLKPVGQGGMGVVYAAYDPELDRKVALKLRRPDKRSKDPVQARMRLLREAQVMARVSHPNVCSVFDVGTFEEQIFVAMEFIEGTTLQQWMDEPRPWREVLRMLLEVGQGLVAVHEAGLVHRDFKPANVLVGKNGRPYVTDFGLARLATSDEEPAQSEESEAEGIGTGSVVSLAVTQHGAMVGTPLFMPPEQYLGLAPDARSDQFSFCAVLYRALFHQAPFDPLLMLSAVKSMIGTGPRPREISPSMENVLEPAPRDSKVPAWVRRALQRGLSQNPKDRYPSLKELLEELSQEPRRARRRRLVLLAGLALAGLAAVAGLVRRQSQVCAGADQLMAEVWNPDVQRKIDAAFKATGKPFAADVARSVTQALDVYARAWVAQDTEACVATRVRGVQTEELLSKRVVCLERRRKDLRALTQVFADADAQVIEKAVNAAGALPTLHECEDVEALAGQRGLPADPDLRAGIDQLGTELAQVKAQTDAGRYKPALALAQQLEPRAATAGYRPLQAEARYRLGWLLFLTGEARDGTRMLEQAFDDAEASGADRLKLWIVGKLFYLYGSQKKWELADRWAGVARGVLDRLGKDELLTSELMANLAGVEILRERYAEARGYLEKSRELQQKQLPTGHPNRIQVANMLGATLQYLGEDARALELTTEALQQAEAAWGKAHPEVARCHLTLGQILHEMGDDPQALAHAEAAVRIWKTALGDRHPLVTLSLNDVGRYQLAQKRYAEALETFQSVLSMQQESLEPGDPDFQYSYDGIGQALLGQGKVVEAIAALEKALSFKEAQAQSLAESHFGLAQALWMRGSYERARAEGAKARQRFLQAGVAKRAAEVEAWLGSREVPRRTRGKSRNR